MPAKITKKQMTKKIADLQAEKAFVEEVSQKYWALPSTDSDFGNSFYDRIHDIEEEIRDAENDWITRNWTFADWAHWELVVNNVD